MSVYTDFAKTGKPETMWSTVSLCWLHILHLVFSLFSFIIVCNQTLVLFRENPSFCFGSYSRDFEPFWLLLWFNTSPPSFAVFWLRNNFAFHLFFSIFKNSVFISVSLTIFTMSSSEFNLSV